MKESVTDEMFRKEYSEVFQGDAQWQSLKVPTGDIFAWDPTSTYIKRPPYFDEMVDPEYADRRSRRHARARGSRRFRHHRHISPAGNIPKDSPAGKYLIEHGVQPGDFNSYGARRGNHE